MSLEDRYPSIPYLAAKARQRAPFFAWEYLASGTGHETLVQRNRDALNAVELVPRVLRGRFTPDLTTEIFGRTYSVPFGAGPVGLSGLMWPKTEIFLAETAARKAMPYALSTTANEAPEVIGPLAGGNGWFQLYTPIDPEIRADMLKRAADSGFSVLVVTVDVPVGSRRERQLVAGVSVPPKFTPKTLFRAAIRPAWSIATLRHGIPKFRTLEKYFDSTSFSGAARLVGKVVDGRPDWEMVRQMRDAWDGPFVIKGILSPEDARRAVEVGADGIVVSNHGGRQFDAAPPTIRVLPEIAAAVRGETKILFDSGIESGVDILRALSLGADFCLLGRAFLYGTAALGARGGDHVYDILRADVETNMIQLGARSIGELAPTAD
ncbi:alpha-hydroxy acid oxidase [Tropicimonas isoalkanivorans]|uniref:L-lactate dehydrogenase (Cytochrome) n=1 Tax=Tropicimonas isoalkanivorans TaxID=441112 RepID=A0A1I1IUM7_9RHOB|nr:alpha-hydroxy acid oxidase [Tropicimonas isoalkanivorans]SFC39885.1 L-lactate dehydrogenase (cytochrome) [Tropicimonas isoalkanivorans]